MATILDYQDQPASTQEAIDRAAFCLTVAERHARSYHLPDTAFGCWADQAVRDLLWASHRR